MEPLATRFRKDSAGGRRDKLRGFGGCWYSGTSLRGVVVRGDEVLLISSRKTPGAWILPAGTAERGETLRETALREVREEAGVACVVARDLGAFADDAKLVRTTFYVMRVATSYAEWEDRDRGRLRRWWRARDASPRLKARDREALAAYLACLEDDDDTRRLGET